MGEMGINSFDAYTIDKAELFFTTAAVVLLLQLKGDVPQMELLPSVMWIEAILQKLPLLAQFNVGPTWRDAGALVLF
jgi:hypothetical protein